MKNDRRDQGLCVRRPFTVDTLGTFFASLAATVLTIPTSILVARFLGPEGKGIVTLVLLVLGQVGMALSLGVEIALIHFAGKRGQSIDDLCRASIGLAVFLGTLGILVAMIIFLFGFRTLLPKDVFWLAVGMTTMIPIALLTTYVRSLIRVSGRIVEEGFLGLFHGALHLVMIAAALIGGYHLMGTLMAFWLSSIVLGLFVVGLGIHWKLVRIERPTFLLSSWRSLVTYGIKLHGGSVFQSLNYRFDVYLVAFFLGPGSVGWYSISVAMAEWLWLLPNVLGAPLMQRVAMIPEEESNRIVGPVNRITSGFLFMCAVLWGLLGWWAIGLLYGESFSASYLPFLLLLPGVWAMGLWKNFMNDLSVRGFPSYKSFTSGIALFLSIILDTFMIPAWKLEGAALASTIAYLTAFLITLFYYCRITGLHPKELLLLRRDDMKQMRTWTTNGMTYLWGQSEVKSA